MVSSQAPKRNFMRHLLWPREGTKTTSESLAAPSAAFDNSRCVTASLARQLVTFGLLPGGEAAYIESEYALA